LRVDPAVWRGRDSSTVARSAKAENGPGAIFLKNSLISPEKCSMANVHRKKALWFNPS
jgi:hypothetical protein